MPTPIPRWKQFVGVGKETVAWNTPAVATTFFPITASDHTPQFEDILDDGYRGNAAQEQAYYQGVGWTDVNWPNMNFYPDTSGVLLMGMLGLDTVTGTARTGTIAAASAGATSLTYTVVTGGTPIIGDIFGIDAGLSTAEQVTVTAVSGGGPFTLTVAATRFAHGAAAPASALFQHALTLNNVGFPPSYTGVRMTALVATAEQIGGIYWEELVLKFANPGRLTVDAKGKGTIQGAVTAPSNVYSTQKIVLPWQGSLNIAAAVNAKLIGGTITIRRPVDMIFGMANSQNANASNVNGITVGGSVEFYSQDQTELNYWLNNTQPAVSLSFLSDVNSLVLQMSKFAFAKGTKLDFGSQYVRTRGTFKAVANLTDGTPAPLKAFAVSAQSASY